MVKKQKKAKKTGACFTGEEQAPKRKATKGSFKKGQALNKTSFQSGQSGNPNGRPKNADIQLLRDAIAEVEKERGVSLYKYAVERAFKSDTMLVNLLRKLVPDMQHTEHDVYMDGLKELLLEMGKRDGGYLPNNE